MVLHSDSNNEYLRRVLTMVVVGMITIPTTVAITKIRVTPAIAVLAEIAVIDHRSDHQLLRRAARKLIHPLNKFTSFL